MELEEYRWVGWIIRTAAEGREELWIYSDRRARRQWKDLISGDQESLSYGQSKANRNLQLVQDYGDKPRTAKDRRGVLRRRGSNSPSPLLSLPSPRL